jgi:HemY protein
VRIETLAAKTPGHLESALAIARAAIDASEFARAREALAPFVAAPTQRVAMLMAEIERIEHGDSGRARAWTLRAVRALHDPVWTADGYVSDRWRPVSPVTGRLDAFQWQMPLAALPSDKNNSVIESADLNDSESGAGLQSPRALTQGAAAADNSSTPALEAHAAPAADSVEIPAPANPSAPNAPTPPLFRTRLDLPRGPAGSNLSPIPPVIPIIRAPDDPGIDDGAPIDEFAEQITPAQGQAGGWRGFLSRLGG